MSIDGSTPEGFKKSFKGCGIVAAGLLGLLMLALVIMLFVKKSDDDETPAPALPANATQSQ